MCLLSDIRTRNTAHWEHIASIANERYSTYMFIQYAINKSFFLRLLQRCIIWVKGGGTLEDVSSMCSWV